MGLYVSHRSKDQHTPRRLVDGFTARLVATFPVDTSTHCITVWYAPTRRTFHVIEMVNVDGEMEDSNVARTVHTTFRSACSQAIKNGGWG